MAKRRKAYGYLKQTGKYEVTRGGEHISFHRTEKAAVRKACRVGGSVYRDYGVAGTMKLRFNCGTKR